MEWASQVLLLIEHGSAGSTALLMERRTGALMGTSCLPCEGGASELTHYRRRRYLDGRLWLRSHLTSVARRHGEHLPHLPWHPSIPPSTFLSGYYTAHPCSPRRCSLAPQPSMLHHGRPPLSQVDPPSPRALHSPYSLHPFSPTKHLASSCAEQSKQNNLFVLHDVDSLDSSTPVSSPLPSHIRTLTTQAHSCLDVTTLCIGEGWSSSWRLDRGAAACG